MKIRHFSLPVLFCFSLVGSASAQSSRGGMGAVPFADSNGTGVTFRTWAPNASSVNVRGSFNGWGTTAMTKDAGGTTWSVDVPRAKAGDEYKFDLNGSWRKDPRGKRVVNSAANSIVYDPNAFDWGGAAPYVPYHNDLVIYQMHVGSFNAEDWLPSTFDECAQKIDYLKSLGISAVQLMPVNEFPGDRSWGYNSSDPYAIESGFGGPDGFKRFVKACHENGIAVLVDVVHNHYGPSDLEMWQYDGWSQNGLGGIYFYNDAAMASTDWGQTRPDFGRGEVRTYIKDQIRMFLEEYRVDGFRWDSVFNILYYNGGGNWNDSGRQMLSEVNDMMAAEFPNALRIAEDHAFDAMVNFQAQWDHGFLSDIRWLATAPTDSDRNMNTLAYHLANGGFNRVVYVESHDTCGDLNNKHRLPYDIQNNDPEGYFPKKRALLANSIVLVSPGIPMIFNGSEMHEWYTFSNNQALRWSNTNTHAGIVRAYSDLIHLRRNLDGVSGGLKQPGNVNVHHVNNSAKVVGLVRWDQGGQTDDLVVVINASATTYTAYEMGFPSPGTWYCLFNSDSKSYAASFGGVGPAIGDSVTAGANATLALGAYSMQIYSKSRLPEDSSASFNPPTPSGCGTTVNITFSPADGALKDASPVYAFIGRNNWQGASNVLMTASGDDWTLAYAIPDDTYQLDISFTDGGTLWDNNSGADWMLPVSNCGDLPAEVSLSPATPQGCIPVKISYEINGGPLTNSTQIYAFIGRNDWQNIQDLALTNETGDTWSGWYSIPDDTWQLDYVFHNSSSVWDNNFGNDWYAIVSGCINNAQPYLSITNPAPATSVSNSIAAVSLQGAASLLTGNLRWTNTLTGGFGSTAVATHWSLADIPLAAGVNLIRVSGTNSAVNPNHGASDSPANSTYSGPQAWNDGMNGGTQFGAWDISTGATASWAVSNLACSFGSYAWALQASGGGFIQAIRPFSASLRPGDKVSFVFENGGVDPNAPSSVGAAFHNRFDQRLAELYFEGGTTNFVVNDTSVHNTGIPWSPDPKNCSFEMLSTLDYRLTVNGQAFEGEFAQASEYGIAYIRFWNYNAGAGDESKFFIGALSVTGAPLPVLTYSSEIAVTRAAASVRTTETIRSVDGHLVVTLDNASGVAGNIWTANAVVERGWNWSPLSPSDYTISNNTVIITPSGTNGVNLLSVGKPGGN